MKLEKMFVEAGGKFMAGTDRTGYGGVIAGFSNQRVVELLMEPGFSVEQAIKFLRLMPHNIWNVKTTLVRLK